MTMEMLSPRDALDRQAASIGRAFQWFEVFRYALRDRSLDGSSKALLGAIGYFMNWDRGFAAAEYRELEQVSGCSQKSLSRASTTLRRCGYIETYRASVDNRGRAVVHYLLGTKKMAEIASYGQELAARGVTSGSHLPAFAAPNVEHDYANLGEVAVDHYPISGEVADTRYPKIGAVDASIPIADCPDLGEVGNSDYPNTGSRLPQIANPPPQNWGGDKSPTSSTIEKNKKMMMGGDMFSPAVELPTAVQLAVEAGTSKVATVTLRDAISAALARGVKPFQIEMSLRKAAGAALMDRNGNDPTPSEILTKAARFVERSDGEKLSDGPPLRGAYAENRDRAFTIPDLSQIKPLQPYID